MSKFAIGEMFWGKAQSYPWWPSVIVVDEVGMCQRKMKKIGIQYHVQFIGNEYDPSWISEEFLVEFYGKDKFEQYVIDQLNSNLPATYKIKFDMRMSHSIKETWNQACITAELLYSMDNPCRLAQLPKSTELEVVTRIVKKRSLSKLENIKTNLKSEVPVKKTRVRKSITKSSTNISEINDQSNVTECQEIKKEPKRNKRRQKQRFSNMSDEADESVYGLFRHDECKVNNDLDTSNDIEEYCFRAYLAQEKHNFISNNNMYIDQIDLEKTLKDRWSVLDFETKLLYINEEVTIIGTSQSKVSGRKIRVPSRLRSNEDMSNVKRSSRTKITTEPISKRSCTKGNKSMIILSVNAENSNDSKMHSPNISPQIIHNANKIMETIDDSLWTGLTSQDCLTSIMKIVIQGSIPNVPKTCYYCFIPLLQKDNIIICIGECQASYHSECAIVNKILRPGYNQLCVYCDHKPDICFICKNSKYMKKTFLVKCQKESCSFNFHVTCARVLTFIESNETDIVVCPNHYCLTCAREDTKHPCNDKGALISCIKCQLSYHDNLICIPAGCRIVSRNRMICYRHFENKFELNDAEQLLRCFLCFKENPTLKCCRCRSIFHPKCLGLATFSDLLQDYVCTTCKLDHPMFYGQIVWIERDKKWIPAEIVDYLQLVDDVSKKTQQSLLLVDLESSIYYFVSRCELIPFESGLSILMDKINVSCTILQLAKLKNTLYWNWRSRFRPVKSEKFPCLGQSELIKYSTKNYHSLDPVVRNYQHIDKNISPKNVKKYVPHMSSDTCTSSTETCSVNTCSNESNCSKVLCNKRLFTNTKLSSVVIRNSISYIGVQLKDSAGKNQFLGECTGTLTTTDLVFKRMYKREHLSSVSYIFQLTEDFFLDCEESGNHWRHLNHSCNPNAKVTCHNVKGFLRLAISSLRPISNEEVTIDYMSSGVVLKYGFICQCQSSNCRTIIGPSSIFLNDETFIIPLCCINDSIHKSDNVSIIPFKETNVPNRISPNISITDDNALHNITCFKCGNHGEFLLCDKNNCNKRYHLSCISTATRPKGIWLCPMHFCYYCGQSATEMCNNCPISCCTNDLTLHKHHKCTQVKDEESVQEINDDMKPMDKEIREDGIVEEVTKETVLNENNADKENIAIENGTNLRNYNVDIYKEETDVKVDLLEEEFLQTKIKSLNRGISFRPSFLDSLTYNAFDDKMDSTNNKDMIVSLKEGHIINKNNFKGYINEKDDINHQSSAPRTFDFENVRYECLPCKIEEDETIISPPIIFE